MKTKNYNKIPTPVLAILALIAIGAIVAFAQTPQTIRTGFTVERELGETDKHIYEVNLTKGQMLDFVVEQRGVDVWLRVFLADGTFVDRVDSPNGREDDEPFKMVSLTGGRYRIEVSRFWEDSFAKTGRYLVKPVAIRQATNAEIKTARLKDELLKIVAEDNRSGNYPNALRRYYFDRALVTNSFAFVSNAAELKEAATNNPFKPPAGFSSKSEFSGVRLEEFGEVALMSVLRNQRVKNPSADADYTILQQISYVFKRAKAEWRIINVQRTFASRELKPVKFNAQQLDELVGVYQGTKASETLTVTREGDMLFGKLGTAGEKFEMFAEADMIFVGGTISVAFVRDAGGTVTHAVIHYPMPNERMTVQPKVK